MVYGDAQPAYLYVSRIKHDAGKWRTHLWSEKRVPLVRWLCKGEPGARGWPRARRRAEGRKKSLQLEEQHGAARHAAGACSLILTLYIKQERHRSVIRVREFPGWFLISPLCSVLPYGVVGRLVWTEKLRFTGDRKTGKIQRHQRVQFWLATPRENFRKVTPL